MKNICFQKPSVLQENPQVLHHKSKIRETQIVDLRHSSPEQGKTEISECGFVLHKSEEHFVFMG